MGVGGKDEVEWKWSKKCIEKKPLVLRKLILSEIALKNLLK